MIKFRKEKTFGFTSGEYGILFKLTVCLCLVLLSGAFSGCTAYDFRDTAVVRVLSADEHNGTYTLCFVAETPQGELELFAGTGESFETALVAAQRGCPYSLFLLNKQAVLFGEECSEAFIAEICAKHIKDNRLTPAAAVLCVQGRGNAFLEKLFEGENRTSLFELLGGNSGGFVFPKAGYIVEERGQELSASVLPLLSCGEKGAEYAGQLYFTQSGLLQRVPEHLLLCCELLSGFCAFGKFENDMHFEHARLSFSARQEAVVLSASVHCSKETDVQQLQRSVANKLYSDACEMYLLCGRDISGFSFAALAYGEDPQNLTLECFFTPLYSD